MSLNADKVHGGPARIFFGVTAGTTGTPPTYITHTDGVPGTGTEVGFTQGETIFSYEPQTKLIEGEQSYGPFGVMITGEAGGLELTVMETTYQTLRRAFNNNGSESISGGDAVYFGNASGLQQPRTECIFVSSRIRTAPTKFIIAVLYKAHWKGGFKFGFKRAGESVYKLMVEGLEDLARNAGDQMGYTRVET